MAPHKFVIKCGNFAVLVDLHVLPLGGQGDASWFTMDHIEEVTALVQDAVDQRVKQFTEFLHHRRHLRQRNDLPPASACFMRGKTFNLIANFLKRHFNLRCVVKQHYGDLRVFPERYVVCVSCPEDATAHHGNPSAAATELSEQSRSEYFSRVGETQEALNSPTKTKKTLLQKITKQASDQQQQQRADQRASPEEQRQELGHKETWTVPETDPLVTCPSAISEPKAQVKTVPSVLVSHERETNKSKRLQVSSPEEDPQPQRTKRTCLGRAPAETHSTESSTQTSKHDLLPLPPLPLVQAKAESKAFPVSECTETTLEVELLTPGKRAQRLPLTSNNTAQTNQNRLAASLRGLSVKPASSGCSISSRSTRAEEGNESVPRTSRLRRLKRS